MRSDHIEHLVDRTDALSSTADSFKRQSTQLRRNVCWSNAKFKVITIVLILVQLRSRSFC